MRSWHVFERQEFRRCAIKVTHGKCMEGGATCTQRGRANIARRCVCRAVCVRLDVKHANLNKSGKGSKVNRHGLAKQRGLQQSVGTTRDEVELGPILIGSGRTLVDVGDLSPKLVELCVKMCPEFAQLCSNMVEPNAISVEPGPNLVHRHRFGRAQREFGRARPDFDQTQLKCSRFRPGFGWSAD